jgi:hypothetical protein
MKGYGRPASPSVKEGVDATGREEDCEGTSWWSLLRTKTGWPCRYAPLVVAFY